MNNIIEDIWVECITLALFYRKNKPFLYAQAVHMVEEPLRERFERDPSKYAQPFFIDVGSQLQKLAQEKINETLR